MEEGNEESDEMGKEDGTLGVRQSGQLWNKTLNRKK